MGWARWMMAGMLVWGAGRPDAQAAVRINEVLADPSADANRDGTTHTTQDEFIELVNTAAEPVFLEQWSLSDLVQVRHRFAAPQVIPGFGFFVVFGGGAPQGFANASIASSGSLGLNNAGDTVTLRDAGTLLVDAVTYGSEGGRNSSLTRSPDGAGPWTLHQGLNGLPFSPGTTVDGRARLEPTPHLPPPPLHTDATGGPVLPEPSSLVLVGLGGLGLALRRRLRGR
ncbi:MAG: lamin tail domain-containing protein [Candidatus Omnitrophica bacterium]|nr:lamin tail domain-containing protein [Candidatus Omnitrophota bacterium]